MTTTLANVDQRVQEGLSDRISVAVTTAITTNTSIISTNLRQFDGNDNDYFNEWWVYITDFANAGVERRIADYVTSSGTITVYGANLASDGANLATIEVTKYRRTDRVNAINRAIEEIGKKISRVVDDTTLITGNWLPNASFERWAVSTNPLFYALSNSTSVADTTADEYWNATKATKVTASAANGYIHIASDTYRRLLDLAGKTVDFTCIVKPQVADDATIEIYTLKADGTAQTLTSTTTCPAGKWTRLELLDQTINEDIQYISVRFKVVTNAKYVIFDDACLTSNGRLISYWLPYDFQVGSLAQVHVQGWSTGREVSSSHHLPADDILGQAWSLLWEWSVVNDGTYNYLNIPNLPVGYRLRLMGTAPLSGALSAATDTIPIDAGGQLDALVAYARYWLLDKMAIPMGNRDSGRVKMEAAEAFAEYQRLSGNFVTPYMAHQLKGL